MLRANGKGALLALVDRWRARWLFLLCALAAAGCTLAAMAGAADLHVLLGWRALTGFFLAGIYPVGMKMASLWFPRGLGTALGWLMGALVLGSASPHALRALGAQWPWQSVFVGVAVAAALAGAMALVPEPPARNGLAVLRLSALASVWCDARVRACARRCSATSATCGSCTRCGCCCRWCWPRGWLTPWPCRGGPLPR